MKPIQGPKIWHRLTSKGNKEAKRGSGSLTGSKAFVYYAFREGVETLTPLANEVTGADLPTTLILPTGIYRFGDGSYELSKEGLYRFVYPGKENQQRIVYEGHLDALLSSVAWIYSHGNSDDDKSFDEINRKALTSKIFATCGPIASWILRVLEGFGTKARLVQILTLDVWNDYDNGHVLVEVYHSEQKKWVVYDLDNSVYFSHHGIPLSLIEFAEHVTLDDYKLERLANDAALDVSNFIDRKSGYDYAFIMERTLADEQSIREWYKRMSQVPLIQGGKFYYFFDANNRSRIEGYSESFRYVDKREFMDRFYN
jgi:hypothetical protein